MNYQYKRFMRDGTVAVLSGSRHAKQVRIGKTAKDRKRGK